MKYRYVYARFAKNQKQYCWEAKMLVEVGDTVLVESRNSSCTVCIEDVEETNHYKQHKQVLKIVKKRKFAKLPVFLIKVPEYLAKSKPNPYKFDKKRSEYLKGEIKPIFVNKKYEIVDGYITYLLSREYGKFFVNCVVV